MYIWSLILFTFTHTVTMQQLPSAEGSLRIEVPSLAQHSGTVQCTIYNDQHEPVRMIPLAGGHKKGVYTLQLKTLPAGEYVVSVQQQMLAVTIN